MAVASLPGVVPELGRVDFVKKDPTLRSANCSAAWGELYPKG